MNSALKGPQAERILHIFLVLLIISLVGNACADFGLIWYCVARIGGATSGQTETDGLLSFFYSGQAFGVFLLAPFLAYFIDKIPRRYGSVLLDLSYALVLCLLIALQHLNLISPVVLFPFAMITAALGSIHRGAIGYGALKVLSADLGVTSIVAKFNASLFFTNLVGASVSGLVFGWFGLNGCLLIAIATFLPMPLIYFKLFKKEPKIQSTAQPFSFRNLVSGWEFILKDKLLLAATLTVTIVNYASNIFPGLVALSFQHAFPNQTLYSSTAVSLSILVGVISYGPASRMAKTIRLPWLPLIALSAPILMLIAASLFPNPFVFTAAFALQCAGAALINTMTGSVRLIRVPQDKIAQVNSSYLAIVYSGQIIGSLTLIPIMKANESLAAIAILIAFLIASVLGRRLLPPASLKDLEAR